ncbi:urea ABC transporter permease subunit UrtC [Nocardiopsis sp. MG754419]|uniref:urea ABC transporter permease subunit UrtC n=1 Tax=Nocardiopsis sp. MG754419 TaxID=2259865 RepID=UPI001BAC4C1C|nr:urea ABC transporter permease subunit UrtC [Nocardiopsis sp. MG754419]MBR8745207.1 urea ABC transporter permease subunit UrtC [Nocardiopsis sp. MG754419]
MTHTSTVPAPPVSRAASLGRRLRGPAVFVALLAAALLVVPVVLEPFRLNLLAQYLCYAIVALGIALAWGRGGMLTLGHGVYFGLGAYAMAMHLTLARAAQDPLDPDGLPSFMVWSGLSELPWFWVPFASPAVAVVAAVLVPGAVAALLGWSVFRQRVRGAYFAILNQALAAAFVLLLVGQQHLTGGSNGLTDFPVFAGHSLYTPTAQTTLYVLTVLVLAGLYLLLRHITRSRFGTLLIAIRDGEDRVRHLGYDPTWAKTLAYALSAMAAGIGGALFVPIMGIISPSLIGVIPSIMMVLAVAIGGRYSLAGAALGAVLMNAAQTTFSEHFAGTWTYLQGALFVVVIALAPAGLAGLAGQVRQALHHRRAHVTHTSHGSPR